MTEWREVALGDVATVAWGDTSITKSAYVTTGVPAYSASGPDGFLPAAHNQGDGVVVSAIGANCGKTWFARGAWSCIKNTLWFQASNDVDARFLYYATADPSNWPKRGAAQPFISLGDAKAMKLDLPPLANQKVIAATLGSMDDLIENNRRRIALLEQMAQAIYQEWFVHFRYPGHEHASLVDSELGPIPDAWDVVELGSVAEAERLTVHPKHDPDAYFDHYSIPAFDDGQLPSVESGETIRSGKYAVTQPAVMVSKLNPRIPRTWFVEPSGARAVASTEFVILRPKGERSLDWTYATVTSPQFEDRMTQLSGGTSGSHQRLRPGDMLGIPVLDPPTELVRHTTDAIGPALAMARRLRLQARELGAIRDLLLPKLVTGQIDVSELDLDAVVGSVA